MGALRQIWRSVERHPWLWTLGLLAPLVAFPQIDLTVSSWFYDAGKDIWPARVNPFCDWVRKSLPAYLFAVAGAVALAWVASELLKRPVLHVTRRIGAFIVLSLALGPGLVVNLILKENWGRPRPSTLVEFGGDNTYVRPLLISDQCDSNCSFSSGHGALGFWPVALALLAPPAWRPAALAAASVFGVVVGFVRIAQGGHFLSDVAFSAAITISLILVLHRWLLEDSGKNHR